MTFFSIFSDFERFRERPRERFREHAPAKVSSDNRLRAVREKG